MWDYRATRYPAVPPGAVAIYAVRYEARPLKFAARPVRRTRRGRRSTKCIAEFVYDSVESVRRPWDASAPLGTLLELGTESRGMTGIISTM